MNARRLLGKQITDCRNLRGLTLRQLADMAGVNYANICKIENGKYNVSVDIIDRICSVLGVTLKLDTVNTLEEFRDYINSSDDWDSSMDRIIDYNGWVDETGEEFGICNDGLQRLYFYSDKDDKLIADIKDM